MHFPLVVVVAAVCFSLFCSSEAKLSNILSVKPAALEISELPDRVCSGSLIFTDVAERGCGVKSCRCMPVLGTCSQREFCPTNSVCYGVCQLSVYGYVFFFVIASFLAGIPFVVFLYKVRQVKSCEKKRYDAFLARKKAARERRRQMRKLNGLGETSFEDESPRAAGDKIDDDRLLRSYCSELEAEKMQMIEPGVLKDEEGHDIGEDEEALNAIHGFHLTSTLTGQFKNYIMGAGAQKTDETDLEKPKARPIVTDFSNRASIEERMKTRSSLAKPFTQESLMRRNNRIDSGTDDGNLSYSSELVNDEEIFKVHYIDVKRIMNSGEFGLAGIDYKPKLALETSSKKAQRLYMAFIVILYATCVFISTFSESLASKDFILNSRGDCPVPITSVSTQSEFSCLALTNKNHSLYFARFDSDSFHRFARIMQIRTGNKRISINSSQLLEPGLNTLATYTGSFAPSSKNYNKVVNNFEGLLVINCQCIVEEKDKNKCGGDGSMQCHKSSLFTVKLRVHNAGLVQNGLKHMDLSLSFHFLQSKWSKSITFQREMLSNYDLRSDRAGYGLFISLVYLLIGVFNLIFLLFFLSIFCRDNSKKCHKIKVEDEDEEQEQGTGNLLISEDNPTNNAPPVSKNVWRIRRWWELYRQERFERRFLVFVLIILVIQNNSVTWLITYLSSVEHIYVVFYQIWDTLTFTLIFGFILTTMDYYRKKLDLVQDMTQVNEVELSTRPHSTSEGMMSEVNSKLKANWNRFVVYKVLTCISFFTTRICCAIMLSRPQLLYVDFILLFLGSSILLSIGINIQQHLSLFMYTKSRLEQLSFRFLFFSSYVMLSCFCLITFFANPFDVVTTWQPLEFRFTKVSSYLLLSGIVFTITLSYFPAHYNFMACLFWICGAQNCLNKCNNSKKHRMRDFYSTGFVTREQRQFVITPRARSGKANWAVIRSIVRREIVPYWKPHGVFCIETACRMFNLSRLAYSELTDGNIDDIIDDEVDSSYCAKVAREYFILGHDNLEVLKKIYCPHSDIVCYIFKGKHRLIISFCGTKSKKNVKTDLAFGFIPMHFPTKLDYQKEYQYSSDANLNWSHEEADVFVHTGFFQAYCSIRYDILETLDQTLKDENASNKTYETLQIYITGHSLGGALATLCSLDVKMTYERDPIMYNFGSPRVGCCAFVDMYNRNVPKSFRVVNEGDLVAGVPKVGVPFIWFCQKRYKHVGVEIVLDGSGNGDILIQPSFAEKNLYMSTQLMATRHLMSSYKPNLQALVERTIFNNTAKPENDHVGVVDDMNEELPISPLSTFLNKRKAHSNWLDTATRVFHSKDLRESINNSTFLDSSFLDYHQQPYSGFVDSNPITSTSVGNSNEARSYSSSSIGDMNITNESQPNAILVKKNSITEKSEKE